MEADFKKAGIESADPVHSVVFSPKAGDTVLRSPLDDFGIDISSAPTTLQIFFYIVVFLQLLEATRRL